MLKGHSTPSNERSRPCLLAAWIIRMRIHVHTHGHQPRTHQHTGDSCCPIYGKSIGPHVRDCHAMEGQVPSQSGGAWAGPKLQQTKGQAMEQEPSDGSLLMSRKVPSLVVAYSHLATDK
eukprot:scaffold13838_cov21-Tisochrysis_lutea.AAC.1